MKKLLIIAALAFPSLCNAQNLKKPNEDVVFAFSFNSEREVDLVMDKDKKTMAFRLGLPKKLELDFPESATGSLEKFTYSYNFRANGAKNDGYNQNYVWFIYNGQKYVIYEEYYATGTIPDVGLMIVDLKTNVSYETKGIPETRVGTLEDFRDESPIKEAPAIFR